MKIKPIIEAILAKREKVPIEQTLLIGISGIDAGGKGFITAKLAEKIRREGIFLFKNAFKDYFDLKIWIECSFETALRRAIQRSQEGLSTEDTIKAYQTIYFPAQKIHFAKDNPQESADLIFDNN